MPTCHLCWCSPLTHGGAADKFSGPSKRIRTTHTAQWDTTNACLYTASYTCACIIQHARTFLWTALPRLVTWKIPAAAVLQVTLSGTARVCALSNAAHAHKQLIKKVHAFLWTVPPLQVAWKRPAAAVLLGTLSGTAYCSYACTFKDTGSSSPPRDSFRYCLLLICMHI